MRVQAGLGHHGLGRGAQLQAVSGGRGGQHRCGHKMFSGIISRCHHRRAALHPLPRVRLRPVSPGPRPPRAQHRRGAAGPRALCALCAGHAARHARQHVRALLPLAGGRGGGAQHRARVRLRAEGGAVSAAQPRHRGCVQVSLAISITYLLHQAILMLQVTHCLRRDTGSAQYQLPFSSSTSDSVYLRSNLQAAAWLCSK